MHMFIGRKKKDFSFFSWRKEENENEEGEKTEGKMRRKRSKKRVKKSRCFPQNFNGSEKK